MDEGGHMTDSEADGRSDGVVKRGLRSTVGRESTTFGFSILVTVTFGLLQTTHGPPDVPRVFMFAVGAAMSFTLLEAILSEGFRTSMPQHRTRVQAVGTSMNVLSVLAGLAAAWLVGAAISHPAAWALAPFLAGVVYLLLESAETALGERLAARSGDEQAEVEP
jgi:MFS family permease